MNVLITSSSRKVSLVEAFKNALLDQGGGKVIAADSNPFSASFYFADKHYILPPDSDSSFLKKVLDICMKESISLLVPTRDEELIIFSENKDVFEEKGVQVMVSSPATISTCQDKLKFFKFCQKNGIPCPKIYNFKDVKKFPVFLNGRKSKASKNAYKINNKKELDFYFKNVKSPVIQEFVSWQEYTVDLFSDFNGRVISAVPRERTKVFGGESFVSKTVKNDKLVEESVKLAKKLKLFGHNTIQCFFNGKFVKFIEVNPRFGGAANLGIEAGANTPMFLVKLVKGEKLEPVIGEFKDGLVMLRYTKDYFINEK